MPVDDVEDFVREFQRTLARLARQHAQEADIHRVSAKRSYDSHDDERGAYHAGYAEAMDATSYTLASLIKKVEPLIATPPEPR